MYKIIRYYAYGVSYEEEVIRTGLTLEEAREHCKDPETREEGKWFDGYTEE